MLSFGTIAKLEQHSGMRGLKQQVKVFFFFSNPYYTVSQIKTPMRTIVHNFVKFLPIFTIFWLADSAGNL